MADPSHTTPSFKFSRAKPNHKLKMSHSEMGIEKRVQPTEQDPLSSLSKNALDSDQNKDQTGSLSFQMQTDFSSSLIPSDEIPLSSQPVSLSVSSNITMTHSSEVESTILSGPSSSSSTSSSNTSSMDRRVDHSNRASDLSFSASTSSSTARPRLFPVAGPIVVENQTKTPNGIASLVSPPSMVDVPTLPKIDPADPIQSSVPKIKAEPSNQAMPPPNTDPSKEPEVDIVAVLDSSGSMSHRAPLVLTEVNRVIAEQKSINDTAKARFSLVTFNNDHRIVMNRIPLANVPQLTAAHYRANGSTALYRTILAVEKEFGQGTNPTVIIVLTDGEEMDSPYLLPQAKNALKNMADRGIHMEWLKDKGFADIEAERLGMGVLSSSSAGQIQSSSVSKASNHKHDDDEEENDAEHFSSAVSSSMSSAISRCRQAASSSGSSSHSKAVTPPLPSSQKTAVYPKASPSLPVCSRLSSTDSLADPCITMVGNTIMGTSNKNTKSKDTTAPTLSQQQKPFSTPTPGKKLDLFHLSFPDDRSTTSQDIVEPFQQMAVLSSSSIDGKEQPASFVKAPPRRGGMQQGIRKQTRGGPPTYSVAELLKINHDHTKSSSSASYSGIKRHRDVPTPSPNSPPPST